MKGLSNLKLVAVFIPFAMSSYFCVSCDNGYSFQDGEVVTVNYEEAIKDVIEVKLSDIIEEFHYVQLDSQLEAYTTYANSISDNYMIGYSYNDGLARLYDRGSGDFISVIGNIGRGPGEYVMPGCNFIDEEAKVIYLYPSNSGKNVIYAYGLDGKLLYEIPLAEKTAVISSIIVDSKSEKMVVGNKTWGDADFCIWTQDLKGNLISKVDMPIKMFEGGFLQKVGDNILIHRKNVRNIPDTLFSYNCDDNSLKPVFSLNIEDCHRLESVANESIPVSYFSLGDYFVAIPFSLKLSYMNGNLASYGEHAMDIVVVNNKSLKSGKVNFVNDFTYIDSEDLFLWLNFNINNPNKEYISISYEPFLLIEKLKEALTTLDADKDSKAIESIKEMISNIDEDGNIVVLYGKI